MSLLTVSADSHITEPGDCYIDRIDPLFRDRAPVAVLDDVMGATLDIDNGRSRIPYGMVAAAGRPWDRIGPFEYVGWDELHILTAKSNIGDVRFRGPKMNSFLGILRANQDIVGTMVFGGVFDRVPALQIICVEADAGWVPHWAYRADHAFDRHRNWLAAPLERKPSEYLFANVSFTFQDDWTAFKMVDLLNHEMLMWANDHPHSDSTWPNSQALLAEQTGDLDPVVRDDIVWRDCARLYGLEAALVRTMNGANT
jgi:hypothetical protein